MGAMDGEDLGMVNSEDQPNAYVVVANGMVKMEGIKVRMQH